MLTDGDDTDSLRNLADVMALAQRSEIQIYALTIHSQKVTTVTAATRFYSGWPKLPAADYTSRNPAKDLDAPSRRSSRTCGRNTTFPSRRSSPTPAITPSGSRCEPPKSSKCTPARDITRWSNSRVHPAIGEK